MVNPLKMKNESRFELKPHQQIIFNSQLRWGYTPNLA